MTGPAAERRDWPAAIRAMVAAGVDWVQVRDRSLSAAALLDWSRTVLEAARIGARERNGTVRVLLNRRADVALAAPADGLHLGFDAPPLADVRRLFAAADGPRFVGLATHSAAEAAAAARAGADYAQLAPIFAPLSKPAERPSLGLTALTEAASASRREGFRLLAQGGIEAGNAAAAIQAGADGVAVTGALLGATHPGTAASRLRATLDDARPEPA